MKLKERYTKVEAKKAKDAVARRVKNGSLEVMQGAAYKAHITKQAGHETRAPMRTGRSEEKGGQAALR